MPVKEGHVFDLGERELEVMYLPGHTNGSIALLDRKNRVLFSGDTISSHFKIKNGDEIYKIEGGYLFKIKAPEGTEIEIRDTQI
ncbi:MBL fold metallo-hydrolase [Clostridium estertheticum]|nr:MBL fold metallo-hydrolase [Clostridium estertheticum]WLC86220.1 MBL fold metallo-hydrolase [Clostridium estertheticum]